MKPANGQRTLGPARGGWWRALLAGLCAASTVLPMPGDPTVKAPLKFTNVTQAAGLDRETDAMRALFVDFDSDGWVDLQLINRHYQPCLLYRNQRNGTFTDVAEASGLRLRFNHAATFWVDLDNDGDQDCLSAGENQDEYFINNGVQVSGEVTFTSRGSLFGRASTGRNTGLAIADFDNDGLVDIFAAQGNLDPRPEPADRALLLRNLGQGKFAEVSQTAGLPDFFDVSRAFWTDLNRDGWPDLIILNNSRPFLQAFLNRRDKFQEATTTAGLDAIAFEHEAPAFFDAMDLNHDGDLDLLIDLPSRCYLYQNGRFVATPHHRLFPSAFDSRLLQLLARADVDNDGFLDLLATSADGLVSAWRGRVGGQFEEKAVPIHAWNPELSFYSLSAGDYDNDGDLDLISVAPGGCVLYRNDSPQHHWLQIQLKGLASNADGIGSRVEIVAKDLRQTITSGVNQQIHFGLGVHSHADSLRISWPSGQVQQLVRVAANQRLIITQPMITNFEDITAAAGIVGAWQSRGAACGDFDNDGHLDLVVNGGHGMLFHNNCNGTFTEVAEKSGIYTTRWSHNGGVAWGDFNNDGRLDLFFTHESKMLHRLFLGQTDGSFLEVTTEAGVALPGNGGPVLLADFDRNGFLDVLIPSAVPVQLFLNQGNATFVESAQAAGLVNIRSAKHMTGCTGDYDNDGDIDVYLTNSNWSYKKHDAPNYLFRDRGDGTFEDVTVPAGVADSTNSKGAIFADYDNDGDLDLYVANDGGDNRLFRNNGDGTFDDMAAQAGVAGPFAAHAPNFADMDNDGDLDLYVTASSWLIDSLQAVHRLLPDVLYRNNGFDPALGWTFTDITTAAGIDNPAHCLAAIWGDIDNDGDLDLFLCNSYDKRLGAPKVNFPPYPENKLYRNLGNSNHYLHLSLVGHRSNRAAIGVRVAARAGDLRQIREVQGGGMHTSQNSLRLAFGFGLREKVEELIIRWPSGIVQTLKQPRLNQILTVAEPFKAGPIQLERATLAAVQWWSWRLGGVLVLLALLWWSAKRVVPVLAHQFRRLALVRKDRHFRPVAELLRTPPSRSLPVPASGQLPASVKVSISLIEFKNDLLLTHTLEQVRGLEEAFPDFHLGRQEKQPYLLRAEKLRHLKLDVQEAFAAYAAYVRHGQKAELSPAQALRDIGHRLHRFFGLAGFYNRLFSLPAHLAAQVEFVLDSLELPWPLVYDEEQQCFLCERFSCAVSFPVFPAPGAGFRGLADETAGRGAAPEAIIFYGDWHGDRKELQEVNAEIQEVEGILRQAGTRVHLVSQDLDQLAELLLEMETQRRNLRVLHYCGHVEGSKLAAGEESYLAPGFFRETVGVTLPSQPIVFLNGCRSGGMTAARGENLSNELLECGAAACLITGLPVHETGARRVAARFYHHFVQQAATAGEALRRTCVELGQARHAAGRDPEYDITRYCYSLHGAPFAKFCAPP
ncbi:FG-GAP-like repeat-containing protein [bacterium]|nr:FG-GAP-like repeat-containing protein [bacterium]